MKKKIHLRNTCRCLDRMAQKIKAFGFGGSGTGVILIIAGIFLDVYNVEPTLAKIALFSGVFLLVALGVLGFVGAGRKVL